MRPLLLLPALFAATFSFAQTGANSDCAHALELPVSSTNVQVVFTMVEGRNLPSAVPVPATACSGSGNHGSAWFSFVATSTTHWIRTEGDDLDESSMEVFSGTCGSLTSVQCFPANGATPMLTGLSVGSTYYLRVITINPSSCTGGQCQVWVAVVSAPPNDECTGAIELPVLTGTAQVDPSIEISTLGATQSQAACTGGVTASNDDVWYRFTATNSTHFFPTVVLSGDDPTIQWFSGGCASLTSIGCNVDHQAGLTPGEEYHIRVYSASTVATVSTRAMAGVFAPALNDECSGALPITVTHSGEQPAPVTVSTINGTTSTVPCGTQPFDVWLSFTAPSTSVVAVCSENQNATLFSGSCGSLTCIPGGSMQPSVQFDGLTVGDTYYLRVSTNVLRKNSTVWLFAPPANDECADAIDLPVQVGSVDEAEYSTYGATSSTPSVCGGTPKDVWFHFTAPSARLLVDLHRAVTPSSLSIEVLSGNCGGLTSILCQTVTNDPASVTGLTPGAEYYIRVYGGSGQTGFRIAVHTPAINDECDGAVQLPFMDLTDYNSVMPVNNVNATNGTGSCDAYRDLWYRFTADHTNAAFLATAINGDATGVELLSGTCGALTSIVCLTDMTNVRAHFTGLGVGTQYYIRLSTLSVSSFTPLLFDQNVNDEITGALDLPVVGSVFAQPLNEQVDYAATQSIGPLCGNGVHPDDDTWFHFIATATTQVISAAQQNIRFTEPDILGGFRIEAFDTLSTDSATLAAHMIGCAGSPLTVTGLTVGHGYWYRAYTYNDYTAQRGAFTTGVSAGDNDEAAGAMTLPYGTDYSATFNTQNATQSQPGANCSVADFADDDIWFKFVATASPARIVVGYHTADVTLELFSGTPGSLTSIACSDNILVLPTLTAGQTYYARLYSWKNATPATGRIGLFITPSLTANSCVDETCLGPVLLENPSIEQGENCLVMITSIAATDGLGTVVAPGWPRFHGGSSDGHSSCAAYNSRNEVPNQGLFVTPDRVLSRSGKGMGGLYVKDTGGFDYTEYLQAPLAEPLVPGEPYLVSFFAATVPGGHVCLNGMGAVLSQGPIVEQGTGTLSMQPQVEHEGVICTPEWVNICGIVVPDGPVDHITIGSFRDQGEYLFIGNTAASAYYYIDDVVVAHIVDANCITSIGDVPPLDEAAAASGDALRVYPNPASDRVNIVCGVGLFGKRGVIEVFDVTGQRMHGEEVPFLSALQPLELPLEWKEGLYLVMVRVDGQAPKNARLVLRR